MKIENQVCTIEQAKRLKELGVTAPPIHLWYELKFPANDDGDFAKRLTNCIITPTGDNLDRFIMHYIDDETAAFHWSEGTHDGGQDHSRCELDGDPLPAYTVAELSIMLGKRIKDTFLHGPTLMWTQQKSMNPDMWTYQAHCYANWLIHLLETKDVTSEQINQRLLTA